MKSTASRFRSCLLAAFLLSSALPSWAGDWLPFHCRESRFSALVPTTPIPSERVYGSFIGKIATHLYTCRTESCVFTFSYTDLPSLAVGLARGQTFSQARDGLLTNCGGKEISYTRINRDNLFTKQLIYQVPPREGEPLLNGKSWLILVGRQLIVFDALTRVGPVYDRQAEKFFASVKIEPEIPDGL
jgi:hypothetical protein